MRVTSEFSLDVLPAAPVLPIPEHVIAVGAVLVTNNMRHFARLLDLSQEDWVSQLQRKYATVPCGQIRR